MIDYHKNIRKIRGLGINPPSVATDLRGTHDISLDAPTPLINAEFAPLM